MHAAEYPQRKAPRLCGGFVTARQGQICKMREPLIARKVCGEELPAPRVPVVPVARAVKRRAEDALRASVLREHRRDMRVMVLYSDEGDALRRRARRKIPRR